MATGGVRAGVKNDDSLVEGEPLMREAGLPPIRVTAEGAARRSVLGRLVPDTLEGVFEGIERGDIDADVLATLAMAEFGVGQGESFLSILPHALEHGLEMYAVDLFAAKGEGAEFVKRFGHHENVRVLTGALPGITKSFAPDVSFAFVHVHSGDEPAAREAIAFAWGKVVPGGTLAVSHGAAGGEGLTPEAVSGIARERGLGEPAGAEAGMVWFRKP